MKSNITANILSLVGSLLALVAVATALYFKQISTAFNILSVGVVFLYASMWFKEKAYDKAIKSEIPISEFIDNIIKAYEANKPIVVNADRVDPLKYPTKKVTVKSYNEMSRVIGTDIDVPDFWGNREIAKKCNEVFGEFGWFDFEIKKP